MYVYKLVCLSLADTDLSLTFTSKAKKQHWDEIVPQAIFEQECFYVINMQTLNYSFEKLHSIR